MFVENGPVVEACLDRARELGPDDWRAALGQVRFNLNHQKAEEARVVSKAFLDRYPENGEMGMSYARSLIQLKEFQDAVAFLETFNVLPYEGATAGRLLYHEACIRAAMDAMAAEKYSEAIKYGEKAKLWPANLGVGAPYNPDTRLDNFMIAVAEQKNNGKTKTTSAFLAVAEYKNSMENEENSKLILQLMALKENGEEQKAGDLLNSCLQRYPESKYMKWVEAKFRGSGQASATEQQILGTSGEIQPYDVVYVDREFQLLVDFMNLIGW